MSKTSYRATTVVLGLFAAGATLGASLGSMAAERGHDPYRAVETFVRIMNTVEAHYVDELNTSDLVDAALEGMVQSLDPHSTWMDPETWREFQQDTQGSYVGIGVQLERFDDYLDVIRVLPGGPAARDGVLSGDQILGVDDLRIPDASPDELLDALDGVRGSTVELYLRRDGKEPFILSTVRDTVHTAAIESGVLEPGIGYIRIVQFQQGTGEEFAEAFDTLMKSESAEGLVIDLRDNTGGLLDEAVTIADIFMKEVPIVSTQSSHKESEREFLATPGGLGEDIPLAVLVNGYSASASEILAAAFQDTQRAPLVGKRTYGKGSVQTVFEHNDGSALKLTIAKYLTPSGAPVAPRNGRSPDIAVDLGSSSDAIDEMIAQLQATSELPPDTRATLLDLAQQAREEHPPDTREDVMWDGDLSTRLTDDAQLRAALSAVKEAL